MECHRAPTLPILSVVDPPPNPKNSLSPAHRSELPCHASRSSIPFTTMSATPMDIDAESSPAPAEAPQLNITRTLGTNVNTTSAVSEVIANFRPTKVMHS